MTTTYYLLPNAAGANPHTGIAWTVNGGGTYVEAIDDPVGSPDDDTTYLSASSAADTGWRVNIQSLSTMVYLINYLKYHYRSKSLVNNQTLRPFSYIGSTAYEHGSSVDTDAYANYVTASLATSPATSAAWLVPEVASLQVGIIKSGAAAGTSCITQMYVEANVEEAGHRWGSMIAGLGPLLGACLTLASAHQILAYHNAKPGQTTIIHANEAPAILAELREWRRPGFVFLGKD
jgi:hypothetical protein